jgi:hypothetical protein
MLCYDLFDLPLGQMSEDTLASGVTVEMLTQTDLFIYPNGLLAAFAFQNERSTTLCNHYLGHLTRFVG